MKKLLVVGVIVLFLIVSIIPSTVTTEVKQSTTCLSNNPPYEPSNPYPENGSIGIPGCLEWTGGDPDGDTVTYDVYFGKTNPPLMKISNISRTIYCPGIPWEDYTTYYWKVRAWDEHGASTKGPIWCFYTFYGSQRPYGPSEGFPGGNYTFCFDLPDYPECEPYYM